MKNYEIKTFVTDLFDIMCGEGQEHEIEFWKPITVEELRESHKYDIAAETQMLTVDKIQYEDITGESWKPTPEDFDEFLEEAIRQGYIREV